MFDKYQELKAKLASLPPPSEFDRQKQALDFAYGNLAASTNHRPSREAFKKLAKERYGWTDEQFDEFAAGRSGWREAS